MRPASLVTLSFAAALLAACNAPQPEVPDEPPKPHARAAMPDAAPAAAADADAAARARPSRPLDRTPATPDLPPLGTDDPVWKQAAERGVAFRGIGQEPGWYVEVDAGATPKLHAMLDYGDRTIDLAGTEPMDGNQGYRGALPDGTEVVVRTRDGPCFDGMSGHRFPAKVELTIGDRTYTGCGAYL
jgi:uncharacterized membrane protein